jgi:hypothetical protein
VRRITDKLKLAFKDAAGLGCFSILRRAERLLPLHSLYSVLRTFFLARAALNTVFKQPIPARDLPAFLCLPKTVRTRTQHRTDRYVNQIVQFFPDRLSSAKWKDRCCIEGIVHLHEARRKVRPLIVAFCHFGPYYLLRFWLRAAGFPAATFVGGEQAMRQRLKRVQDRFSPAPEIPVVFYQKQLREAVEFLAAGNLLLIAIDAPSGKQIDVPFCEGWTFQMATGAMRLASRCQAELLPCSIVDEGCWHFGIKFGPPVPRIHLATEAGWPLAGRHLIDQWFPDFQARPDQCWADLTKCLKRNPPSLTLNS